MASTSTAKPRAIASPSSNSLSTSELEKQRQFWRQVMASLGISHHKDLYLVPQQQILDLGGGPVLLAHGNSLFDALAKAFPETTWFHWQFGKVPRGFWTDKKNRLDFFEWIRESRNIVHPEGWYSVHSGVITENGGRALLSEYYKNSLRLALEELYPNVQWLSWRFNTVPDGYWKDQKNQRAFFDWAAVQLRVEDRKAWYSVKSDVFRKLGNLGPLPLFGHSLHKALKASYPDHAWDETRFGSVSRGYWDSDSNVREVVKDLERSLEISELSDWYRVGRKQLESSGLRSLLLQQGGLLKLLESVYPEHEWNPKLFLPTKKVQHILVSMMRKLFPGESVLEDFKHASLRYPSNARMELDIFLPDKNLALEYNGKQHYESNYVFGSHEEQRERDLLKIEACKALGITLIEIPYWWDQSELSLAATIAHKRADLASQLPRLAATASPIESERSHPIADLEERTSIDAFFVSPIPLWQNQDPKRWLLQRQPVGERVVFHNGSFFLALSGRRLEKAPSLKVDATFPIEGVLKETPGGLGFVGVDIVDHALDASKRADLLSRLGIPFAPINLVTSDTSFLPSEALDEVLVLRAPNATYPRGSNSTIFQLETGQLQYGNVGKEGQVLRLSESGVEVETIEAHSEPVDAVLLLFKGPLGWKVAARSSLTKDEVWAAYFPYTVGFGKKGGVPSCRGCGKKFEKVDEVRVKAEGSFLSYDAKIRRGTYHFCPSLECIERAHKKVSTQLNALGVRYPTWNNVMRSDSNVKATFLVEKGLAALKDDLWKI